MLDEAKKQKLSALINSSAILSLQEKNEWLTLLELMNDKQLQELEELLSQPAVEPKSPVVPQAVPKRPVQQAPEPKAAPIPASGMPSLSHIANIPSQIVDQRLRPASKSSFKNSATPSAPIPAHIVNKSVITPSNSKSVSIPTTAVAEHKDSTNLQQTTSQLAKSGNSVASNLVTLTKPEDVAQLTVAVLHNNSRRSFFEAISKLVTQHGYFAILTNLESSPLYKDYIKYGRIKLAGQTAVKLPLSQEEFEFVTDLLLALKINRL